MFFTGCCVHLDDHVPGLEGGLGAAGRSARADGGHEHAGLAGAFHFLSQQARKVPHGQPPRFEFLLRGKSVAALDRHRAERDLLAVALDDRGHLLADRQAGQPPHEIRHLLLEADIGRAAAQAQEQVAGLESRFVRRGMLDHAADQHSALVRRTLEERLHIQAEPAPLDLALGHDLFGDALGQVAGDGAAEAVADFVDADDLAAQVHQRAAGIPAVDGGVVPDPTNQRADVFAVQPEAPGQPQEPGHGHLGIADDAQRNRLGQRHGAAHSQHVFAHLDLRGIPELGGLELDRVIGFELEDRNVRERVGADQFGLDLLPVPQGAEDAGGMAGDMVVGDEVSVLGNDRPAADGLHFDFAPLAVFGGDDANPHQGRFDLGNRRINLRPQRGRDAGVHGAGACAFGKHQQTESESRPPEEMKQFAAEHLRSCRTNPRPCKH